MVESFEEVLQANNALVHDQGKPATEKEAGVENGKIVIGQSAQEGFDKGGKLE